MSLGRALVIVQTGEHEAVRSRVLSKALRVLQQPGIERSVLRHQPHPAADPAAHLGSNRNPAEQFVRPTQGFPEQPLRLVADAPDMAAFCVRQRVPSLPALIPVCMHSGNHAQTRCRG
ncbi:hypothetical protein GCM10010264_37830 [Streptomyces globisporus]|nr:hypothetical protein GCM10010264_37830 [Streptomyces globisporus]